MPAVNGRSALRVEGAELFYTGPPPNSQIRSAQSDRR